MCSTCPSTCPPGAPRTHTHAESLAVSVRACADVEPAGVRKKLKIEVEVPGITDKLVKNETLLSGKSEMVLLDPPLRADFKPQSPY